MEAGYLLESAMEAGLLEEILQMEVPETEHQAELVMGAGHLLESAMEAGLLEAILQMEVPETEHQSEWVMEAERQ